MGCAESADNVDVQERDAPVNGLPNNFSKQQFQDARTKQTIDEQLKYFNKLGTCMNGKKNSEVPSQLTKVCFLCCNTYTKPDYALGPGPLNDSLTVAENHKKRGYQIFYLHNPDPKEFLAFLQVFLSKTQVSLTVFFTGHGANIKDTNGDESDGQDEAMVFDNGYIVDDQLVEYLEKYANGKARVLLLTDCCHSGSIWDLQSAQKAKKKLPKNIISISAAKDSQTAKQANIGKKSQGLFTYYFWKIVNENPNITAKQIEAKINPFLQKFKQVYQFAATAGGPENQPLFKK